MKTIALAGADTGLGLLIAKKIGKDGFQVALVARNEEKPNLLAAALKQDEIGAACRPDRRNGPA